MLEHKDIELKHVRQQCEQYHETLVTLSIMRRNYKDIRSISHNKLFHETLLIRWMIFTC